MMTIWADSDKSHKTRALAQLHRFPLVFVPQRHSFFRVCSLHAFPLLMKHSIVCQIPSITLWIDLHTLQSTTLWIWYHLQTGTFGASLTALALTYIAFMLSPWGISCSNPVTAVVLPNVSNLLPWRAPITSSLSYHAHLYLSCSEETVPFYQSYLLMILPGQGSWHFSRWFLAWKPFGTRFTASGWHLQMWQISESCERERPRVPAPERRSVLDTEIRSAEPPVSLSHFHSAWAMSERPGNDKELADC